MSCVEVERPPIDFDLEAEIDSAWLHSRLAQTRGEQEMYLSRYMRLTNQRSGARNQGEQVVTTHSDSVSVGAGLSFQEHA